MSFPNIPDIDPKIELDINDIVNLLLASIAFEELGLAHIINAAAEEIQSVLGTLEGQTVKNPSVSDLEKIDKSVEKILRDVIKKEMLLEFKLEEVLSISTSSTSSTTTSSTTSTTTQSTTSTTMSTTTSTTTSSTTSTTTQSTTSSSTTKSTTTYHTGCGITGSGSGTITSGDSRFTGGIANIEDPSINDMCGGGALNHLSYLVTRGERTLTMTADLNSLKVFCPCEFDPNICCPCEFNPNPTRVHPNTMFIKGTCDIILHDSPNADIIGTGTFLYIFTDGGTDPKADSFRIIILSSNIKLNHDSGTVILNGDLDIINCL